VVEQPQDAAEPQSDEIESAEVEPQAPIRRPRLGPASGPAQYFGTGKRKTSVARVILRPGDGATWFNGRTIEDYFPRLAHRAAALAPLKTAGVEGTYDIRVRVHGGGPTGQAGAVRHGIARALVEVDPSLRVPLKREGYLTRDAREVERKKAGLHKARKAPQFSKR
jgi:small subunit ribosomal protein S9